MRAILGVVALSALVSTVAFAAQPASDNQQQQVLASDTSTVDTKLASDATAAAAPAADAAAVAPAADAAKDKEKKDHDKKKEQD